MVQMMMRRIGGATLAHNIDASRSNPVARKVFGLAIVTSGYAVLLAHGLHHALGG
jgi:hypothetical protein